MKPTLVIIGGPTAVGKTAVSIQLAQYFKTEIISADSRQFYKEMNIGTAVPSEEELSMVKHHFIQNLSVEEKYNASSFERDTIKLLDELYRTYHIVFLVGGSGLYIDAICNGIDDLPSVPADIRKKYNSVYELEGLEKIQQLLKENDPEYYTRVDLNNHKRILKALEVFDITKQPYSSFLNRTKKSRSFNVLKIFLDIDRNLLYEQINKRVETMIEAGLVEEVRELIKYRNDTPLNTVGYKELFSYFDGKISQEEAITQIKNHTRAYARRQLTWFRRYADANWFHPKQVKEMTELIIKTIHQHANQ